MYHRYPCAIALMAGLLLTSTFARADYVRVIRESVDFSSGYVMADGSLYAGANAAFINSQVSSAWSSFSSTYSVLRFYASFNDPADRMIFFGSTESMALDINVVNPTGRQFFESNTTSILPPSIINATTNVNLAFDSWLTVGAAAWDIKDKSML